MAVIGLPRKEPRPYPIYVRTDGLGQITARILGRLRNYETGEFRQTMAREVEHLYRGEYWVKHFEISATDQ